MAEALNFTKAAAQLRIAQPALSRQVQDLEDEIGVDLFRRSPRGVTLTAEGRLFLEETRETLQRVGDSVEKVQALARGDYGDLHIGYAPSPTIEILPQALAAFEKAAPRVRVILHDLSGDEMAIALREGRLELAITAQSSEEPGQGLQYEELRRYAFCVAVAPGHPFTKLKTVSIAHLAAEPLVALNRRDYSEYYKILDNLFTPHQLKPRIAVECDSASSLITGVEAKRGVAIVTKLFKRITGNRLVFRNISDASVFQSVGIARAINGDVTPAGEKFCSMLRETASSSKSKF